MVAGLTDELQEIDVNPVVVHAGGCIAVDALVVGRRDTAGNNQEARRAV